MRVETSTWLGITSEAGGTSSTSSNVRASPESEAIGLRAMGISSEAGCDEARLEHGLAATPARVCREPYSTGDRGREGEGWIAESRGLRKLTQPLMPLRRGRDGPGAAFLSGRSGGS